MGTESNRKWRDKNREKVRAHTIVNNHVRAGKIERKHCQQCGEESAHAHHEDYDKPLEITWLCSRCHRQLHATEKGQSLHPVQPARTPQPPRLSWHSKYHPAPVRDKLLEEARALRERGYYYRQIAAELGVSKGAVYKWLNDPDYY